MAKSKKENKKPVTIGDKKSIKNEQEDSLIQPFDNSPIVLMPELEELVKKNPNRLIGCGG